MFTKIGSYLGTLAFGLIVCTFLHQLIEINKYTPPPTLEQQFKNVVAITTTSAYCSGWVLKDQHVVVTAAHCAPEDPTEVLAVDFGDGKQHPFYIQKQGDFKLVDGPDLMTLTTSDDTVVWPVGEPVCKFKPYYGEKLTMFGGPLGFSWAASFGHVSRPAVDLTDIMLMTDTPKFADHMIQYDGAMWPGNSGGMVVDDEIGCVMGSAELIKPAEPMSGFPDGVKFLTPISDLEKLK